MTHIPPRPSWRSWGGILWVMIIVFSGTGCGPETATPGTEVGCAPIRARYVDLADFQKYTITQTCAFQNDVCHDDEDPPPMQTVGHFFNMINVPCNEGVPEETERDQFCRNGGVLVSPGHAEESYIMIRLTGDTRSTRTPMPLGGEPLPDEETFVLSAWINGLVAGTSTPSDPIDYAKTPCPF